VAACGDWARRILVEDFVAGPEVALEGLVIDGRLAVLGLFDKPDPLDGPFLRGNHLRDAVTPAGAGPAGARPMRGDGGGGAGRAGGTDPRRTALQRARAVADRARGALHRRQV